MTNFIGRLNRLFVSLLVVGLPLKSAPIFAAQDAYIVTEIINKAMISGSAKPLVLMDTIGLGAQIEVFNGATVVVFDGAMGVEFRMKGPGKYALDSSSVHPVGNSLPPVKVELNPAYKGIRVQSAGIKRAGISMRSLNPLASSMRPAAETVNTDGLKFSWRGAAGEGAQLILQNENGSVVWQSAVQDSPEKLPSNIALNPGATYRWQIKQPFVGESRQTWAEFVVLTRDQVQRIANARPSENSGLSSKVAFALLLEEVQARSLANDVWTELEKANPEVRSALGLK